MKKIPVFLVLVVLALVVMGFIVSAAFSPIYGNHGVHFILYMNGEELKYSEYDDLSGVLLTCEEKPSSNSQTCPYWVENELLTFDFERNCYWQVDKYNSPDGSNSYLESENSFLGYYGGKYIRLLIHYPNSPTSQKFYKSESLLVTENEANEGERDHQKVTFEADLNSDGSITFRGDVIQGGYAITEKNVLTFIGFLTLTLILKLIVAFIYILKTKTSKDILKTVFLVNIISLIIVWILYYLLNATMLTFIMVELFAILFEGIFIYKVNKDVISLKSSFVLSTLMNLASVILGSIIVDALVLLLVAY